MLPHIIIGRMKCCPRDICNSCLVSPGLFLLLVWVCIFSLQWTITMSITAFPSSVSPGGSMNLPVVPPPKLQLPTHGSSFTGLPPFLVSLAQSLISISWDHLPSSLLAPKSCLRISFGSTQTLERTNNFWCDNTMETSTMVKNETDLYIQDGNVSKTYC